MFFALFSYQAWSSSREKLSFLGLEEGLALFFDEPRDCDCGDDEFEFRGFSRDKNLVGCISTLLFFNPTWD